jgi:hypothetical protein
MKTVITKELLEQRLEQFQSDRAQIVANISQAQANVNAMDGAIQDCQYWLSQFPPEVVEAKDEDKTSPANR